MAGLPAARDTLLIVEDDDLVAQAIAREARPIFSVRAVTSAAEAQRLFVDDDALAALAAAVIDVGLPDGDGLEVAAALRARRASLPVLVLTASNDPTTINRAHALRAEFVCKPFFRDNLKSFLLRLAAAPGGSPGSAAVERMARERALTSRETQILALAVDGVPRAHLAEVLGVSENTVKTQIRSLLEKTSTEGLADLVWSVKSGEP